MMCSYVGLFTALVLLTGLAGPLVLPLNLRKRDTGLLSRGMWSAKQQSSEKPLLLLVGSQHQGCSCLFLTSVKDLTGKATFLSSFLETSQDSVPLCPAP